MRELGTVSLTSERLVLRRFVHEDAVSMYQNWANDDEVTRYLTWPSHENLAVSEQLLKLWVERYQLTTTYSWAICLKTDISQPIGSIALGKLDKGLESMEVGYALGQAWWRKGYTSEAFACIIQFAFKEIGINRLVGHHVLDNPNSGLVMKKCGMQYEGKIREGGFDNQGQRVDLQQYSLLASDV